MTNDHDYLGNDFYRGETVYWTHHDGHGNDPRRQGKIVAIDGDDAWVHEKHEGKVTVRISYLFHSQDEGWTNA